MLSSFEKTTIMASLALLVSTPALAEGYNNSNTAENKDWKGEKNGAIDALPDKGTVSLQGKIESVDNDKKRFVISDNTGDTIDVHTNSAVQVKEGDMVKVQGTMQSEVAGIGQEIVSANIEILK